MPAKAMPVKEAAQIALRIAEDMQVELIDVELVKEPTGRFLRFYIDKEARFRCPSWRRSIEESSRWLSGWIMTTWKSVLQGRIGR